jgi:hypothetical protein
MNELCPPVPEKERVFFEVFALQELRINGDRGAFVNANFQDFIALLESGSGIWLNRNILACSNQMTINIRGIRPSLFQREIDFIFEKKYICLWCKEPTKVDEIVGDMLLEAIGRCKAFMISARKWGMPPVNNFISSEVLRKFLTRNELLKELAFSGIKLSAEACGIVGRLALGLDSVLLSDCGLDDLQLIADGIKANTLGPKKIIMYHPENTVGQDSKAKFSTVVLPLLQTKRLQVLHLLDETPISCTTRSGNLQTFKAALQSSQSITELRISWLLDIQTPNQLDQLELFFKGLVAVPKLRMLQLELEQYHPVAPVSSRQQLKIFAKALKEHQNSSLDRISCTFINRGLKGVYLPHKILKREVWPILELNRERRSFQVCASKNHGERVDQLIKALETANIRNDHHLCFWLVRNHAGDLCCGSRG